MKAVECLNAFVDALIRLDIQFMVVGSYSSNVYIRQWTDQHGTRAILDRLLSEI